MILNRLGNKKKIAAEIQQYFPPHKLYVEPFFGAGGMFFNKPKASHNILNDYDQDVYNLFYVIMNDYDEFIERLEVAPYHEKLFKDWVKHSETDDIWRAVRFVFLSNFSYLGKMDCMIFSNANDKQTALLNAKKTINFLKDLNIKFMCCDFRKVLKSISISEQEIESTFVYCDPPYLETTNNYSSGFTEKDSNDLFDHLQAKGTKWAMSEFDHPFILEQAEKRNLYVNIIGERNNIKNRRTEVLITNYKQQTTLF